MNPREALSEKLNLLNRNRLAMAAIGLTTVACQTMDFLISPEPDYSFARGFIGAGLLLVELRVDRLISIALTQENNLIKALGIISPAIITLVGGYLSKDTPGLSYALFVPSTFVMSLHLLNKIQSSFKINKD